jgi:hypothetical protein
MCKGDCTQNQNHLKNWNLRFSIFLKKEVKNHPTLVFTYFCWEMGNNENEKKLLICICTLAEDISGNLFHYHLCSQLYELTILEFALYTSKRWGKIVLARQLFVIYVLL